MNWQALFMVPIIHIIQDVSGRYYGTFAFIERNKRSLLLKLLPSSRACVGSRKLHITNLSYTYYTITYILQILNSTYNST